MKFNQTHPNLVRSDVPRGIEFAYRTAHLINRPHDYFVLFWLLKEGLLSLLVLDPLTRPHVTPCLLYKRRLPSRNGSKNCQDDRSIW